MVFLELSVFVPLFEPVHFLHKLNFLRVLPIYRYYEYDVLLKFYLPQTTLPSGFV